MPYKPSSSACALAILALALALALTSCATPPPAPPLAIAWPSLRPPPETGIELAPDGRVLVPLDYWTDLVGYVRRVDDVRAILDREGRLVSGKE